MVLLPGGPLRAAVPVQVPPLAEGALNVIVPLKVLASTVPERLPDQFTPTTTHVPLTLLADCDSCRVMACWVKLVDSKVPDQTPASCGIGGGVGAVGVSEPQADMIKATANTMRRFIAVILYLVQSVGLVKRGRLLRGGLERL